jgi:hypothetical protein
MSKSKATPHSPHGLIDTDFDSGVIDDSVARDFKMFRLAQNVGALVVHRSIRNTWSRWEVSS